MKGIKLYYFLILTFCASSIFAAEDSTYNFNWLDPDKEVYVLQNRKFRKVNKFYMNLGFGKSISGAFADATAIQGRAGYFFKEEWGIEFLYSANSSDTNETFASVQSQSVIPFVRKIQSYYGGMLLWSPFYGKLNTFDKIVYFDWIFGLGLGKINEENNRANLTSNSTSVEFVTESNMAIFWNAGMRFYLTQRSSVRLDVTAAHYQSKKALANASEEAWYDNFDLTAAYSFTF